MKESILFTVVCIIIVLGIRNYLVFRIRCKVIDFMCEKNIDAINNFKPQPFDMEKSYNTSFKSYSYDVLNITKWTLKDFYPDIKVDK